MTNKINKCDGNHGGPRCADPECWNDAPVPPAGGEVEVYAYMVRKPNGSDHLDFENEYPSDAGYKISELIRREDHRAHVTRLQAEAFELRTALQVANKNTKQVRAQRDARQAELTRALELLTEALQIDEAADLWQRVKAFLSNQSAPADKCISCDGTGVDLDGAVNPDGGPSDCLECGGRGSLPNKLAPTDKGQGEPAPALTDDQIFQAIRPPIDKSDGGYICDTDKESAIKAGRAVVAALNEVCRLNGRIK